MDTATEQEPMTQPATAAAAVASAAPRIRPAGPQRYCRIGWRQGNQRLLTIRKGSRLTVAIIEEITASIGRAFTIKRVGGRLTISVRLDGPGLACSCRTFQSRRTCDHVDALTALDAAGYL